jgi:hypothetical protein
MTKIDPKKIVRAAIGSSRLEGYKGSAKNIKNNCTDQSPDKPKSKSESTSNDNTK